MPGFDIGGVFMVGFVAVDQMLRACQLQCRFIGRFDVKVLALLVSAALKCDGFRVLPPHAPSLAPGL